MTDLSPVDAERLYRQVRDQHPDVPEAHNNHGVMLLRTGRLQEAEDAFRQALALRSDYLDACYNLALVLQAADRPGDAEAAYRRALTIQPGHAESHHNLGNVLKTLGRLQEAEVAYRRAIEIRPQYPLALNNLASVLKLRERYIEAELACRCALELQPRYADAYITHGTILEKLGRLPEAETAYRQAIAIRPDFVEGHYNLGNVLQTLGSLDMAEASYREALALRPDSIEVLNNLGGLLQALGLPEQAAALYRQALALRPGLSVAHYNLGTVLKSLDCFAEAESEYRAALAIDPDYSDARFGLATLLLSFGQYEEAWAEYEARYEPERFVHRKSEVVLQPCPRWRGESLQGRSLLVWQEDGLGDMVQFGRYLTRLKSLGVSRLTVACLPPMHRLLRSVEGVDAVVDHADAQARAGEFACWTSLMSVPLRLGMVDHGQDEALSPAVYLTPDPVLVERWRARLDVLPPGLRVGLVWKGNPKHHNDAHRSLPSLAVLEPLWQVPGVQFVSLQKGEGEDEAATPPEGQPLLHLGSEVVDLADSAAIVAQLDLVICVDTAIAHIAGSVGTPCWVLLPPQDIDWRWMHGREDSPWYPGVRLFRRSPEVDWNALVERVRREAETFMVVDKRAALNAVSHR
ncbi:tetratricopeptide repeat protein [Paraburkholderia dinghuensis]|uniref:Tetratricopeptide repeat protein n=1 Tax=Paraburkholderia dinghuensis TaxID=2305225 RepID=A0A3N6N5S5_9BURK|nr:tetratricopeptide repeat protein [Paraburkholderia dinghuensis]RQH06071.1 tetratricopeptide repeat protein [Paraburkholderia dinghuensis]